MLLPEGATPVQKRCGLELHEITFTKDVSRNGLESNYEDIEAKI